MTASSDRYSVRVLRVDLTRGETTVETPGESILRAYVGGVGIGAYYLYKEVPPGTEWFDLENRMIIATGPLTGTVMGGSGGFAVVTKGPLTNGAANSGANGFLGAYLRFCGFDDIIVQGKAERLSYLYVHDGAAEIRNASHLQGKDTWETERLIKDELKKGERGLTVFCIGPAGEHLVKFAAIVGDKGHVAAHNGVGAVMGSKNLKAIAVARGKGKVTLCHRERFVALAKGVFEKMPQRDRTLHFEWGTLGSRAKAENRLKVGYLPIKNYTTSIFPAGNKLSAEDLRSQPQFKSVRHPCWACRYDHCRLITIVEGPFSGYEGEEPDYEPAAGFGPLIGNADWPGIVVLANEADRLGIDANEAGWLVAWLMECYEKGLMGRETMDGLEMTWGSIEATKAMLHRIARREGFGDVLAEGVRCVAERVGGEAQKLAVYTRKGNTPRMHDHRASWPMLIDTVTSDRGRDMHAPFVYGALFTPKGAVGAITHMAGGECIKDSLVVCQFQVVGVPLEELAELVSTATGWDVTGDELKQQGLRVANLLKVFNIRHGHTRDLDAPSARYGSAPSDGPYCGKSIAPVWDETLGIYYESMGWDRETGKPLPDTLRSLGLEHTITDIWEKK